eukprot:scaffold625_cov324-Pavlova_lutheri.AAC.26
MNNGFDVCGPTFLTHPFSTQETPTSGFSCDPSAPSTSIGAVHVIPVLPLPSGPSPTSVFPRVVPAPDFSRETGPPRPSIPVP